MTLSDMLSDTAVFVLDSMANSSLFPLSQHLQVVGMLSFAIHLMPTHEDEVPIQEQERSYKTEK